MDPLIDSKVEKCGAKYSRVEKGPTRHKILHQEDVSCPQRKSSEGTLEETVLWQCGKSKGNVARARAMFVMWLTCHNRLATIEMLHRFG